MSRRAFLKASTKGAAATVVISPFLGGIARRAFAAPVGSKMKTGDYYDHFQVDEALIRKVIAEALSRGGDYCDLYFQHSISGYVGLEDEAVNRAYTDIDYGVGIRVLKGDQTGYAYTEEITPETMKQAARTAANIASSGGSVEPVGLTRLKTGDYYPIDVPWDEVSIDDKVPYLQGINSKVFAQDPRVIKCNIWFGNKTSYVMVATSEGRIACDYRPMGTIYLGCTAEQDGRREQNYVYVGGRTGMEAFTSERADYMAGEVVRRTVDLFEAVKPEAGEMELVLAAGHSGILLHEAIGHGMEADFNRKKISIFCDKMDKRVAADFVTIVDDATVPGSRGSLNMDDEGNPTEQTVLVENGILRSYMHDLISSRHYGVEPTGNGRRQSFRYPPRPRMRSTYMLNGPHTPEEIIASVKHGLYADSFTNGQVYIGAGDFTFYVKSGYMIENGKLTRPVKDVNIIGNGPEVLGRISMVADDLALGECGGTCGKDGQRVPVNDGLPTTKVSSITVGGVNA
jgi:TldD protein